MKSIARLGHIYNHLNTDCQYTNRVLKTIVLDRVATTFVMTIGYFSIFVVFLVCGILLQRN